MTLRPNNNFGANLIGASIAILLAIPIGALVGSIAGDTYKVRVLVYIICLCYVNIGVVSLFYINRNSTRSAEAKTILLWIVSIWFWPILVWTYFANRFQRQQQLLKQQEKEEKAKRLKEQMKNKKWK
ncbi:MAG: hypothetical protein LUC43_02555 [Burkholderiales bacterium]|nr:hypothetical protein [Burkholderiales bacterium]